MVPLAVRVSSPPRPWPEMVSASPIAVAPVPELLLEAAMESSPPTAFLVIA
jgi:hypothetical protein